MNTAAIGTRIQLQNILYCTDLSDASSSAASHAAGLAQHFGAKLYALYVQPPNEYYWVPPAQVPELQEYTEERARQCIRRQLGSIPGVHEEILIGEGDVWTSVAATIEDRKVDLLVIGTRGRTGLKKFLLGSAAEEIFRRALCPVLTVGPHLLTQPSRQGEISNILYATDFGPESQAAAPYAISLAQEYQARLTLVHVVGPARPGDLLTPEQIQSAAEWRLRQLLPAGSDLWCEPHCVVREGNAADEILRLAEQRKADSIVLGVHRPSGVPGAETHLGMATAHRVVSHATCPVLTVRG